MYGRTGIDRVHLLRYDTVPMDDSSTPHARVNCCSYSREREKNISRFMAHNRIKELKMNVTGSNKKIQKKKIFLSKECPVFLRWARCPYVLFSLATPFRHKADGAWWGIFNHQRLFFLLPWGTHLSLLRGVLVIANSTIEITLRVLKLLGRYMVVRSRRRGWGVHAVWMHIFLLAEFRTKWAKGPVADHGDRWNGS